jgi:hypothetical protein
MRNVGRDITRLLDDVPDCTCTSCLVYSVSQKAPEPVHYTIASSVADSTVEYVEIRDPRSAIEGSLRRATLHNRRVLRGAVL